MPTSSINGTGNNATEDISSATGMFTKGAAGTNNLDKDSFLLLLVTQFKHQDPLNPMEDREFIAQLATFSSLEQQMNTNATMEKMYTLEQQQQTISAVTYIGKNVSARGYGVSVDEKGNISRIQFSTSDAMTRGYANIYDASGNLVNTVQLGAYAPGVHDFTEWDGRNSEGGPVGAGVYTVNFAAFDAAGQQIPLDTSVSGLVTGVMKYQGEQILNLSDGRMVALSNVREVQAPTAEKPEEKPEDKPDETPGEKPGETPGDTPGTGS